MGTMIIHIRIMPESIEADVDKLSQAVKEKITSEAPVDDVKLSITDVAFGLKAVNAYFVIDEGFNDFDVLEEKIREIEGVSSTEIVDMRRALG
ncbi:MAG TPA: elongation factor 1-beta [Candidatus Woesearchaeota archaeon]|nr:elongation factor 1-beta [Candidatus Woesearchaeota archaeon]